MPDEPRLDQLLLAAFHAWVALGDMLAVDRLSAARRDELTMVQLHLDAAIREWREELRNAQE